MEAPLHALLPEHLAFGGARSSGFFEGQDGARLRYAIFRPAKEPARGTVVIVQGRNECIEKYLETLRELTDAGLAVATFDLRGQALSGRLSRNARAGHVRRFDDYLSDVERFLSTVVKPVAPPPVHLFAHSLGGLIALSIAPQLGQRIGRMVLSAPLVGLTGLPVPPRIAYAAAAFYSAVGLGARPLGRERGAMPFEDNPLTSSRERFDSFARLRESQADLAIGPPTARWLNEVRKAMTRVNRQEHLTNITIPTVILAPVLDGIVPFSAMEALSRRFRASRLIPIPGARHELLMETDRYRSQALAATLAFLDLRN